MKRFTETEKWSDGWFQSLSRDAMILFIYLCDNCNNAGFMEENQNETCFYLRMSEAEYQGAIKDLGRAIKRRDGWLWVKNFLKHQKTDELNPLNRFHSQIISLFKGQISRFGDLQEFREFIENQPALSNLLGPSKGLTRPTGQYKDNTSTRTSERTSTKEEEVQEEKPKHLPMLHDPQARRLGGIFNRRESTPWCDDELNAYKKLGRISEEDVSAVEEFYAKYSDNPHPEVFLRTSLLRLLKYFRSEVDKARNFNPNAHCRNGHSTAAARQAVDRQRTVPLKPEEMPRVYDPLADES